MEGLAAGAYDIHASMPSYLRHVVSQVIVHAGARTTVPEFALRGGDVNADGDVSLADLVSVSLRYGSQVPPGAAEDIDGDTEVDLVDLVLVARNYGASASSQ
jgi:hypothetical protein